MPYMRHTAIAVLSSALGLTMAGAAAGDDLKLSRVSLFSSGVGYFQADGTVEGNATSELRFRTAQINDIIKSLVLQDFDGGAIQAVQYPSRDPIEKTLKSFGVDITGKPTLGQLLDQLRGVEVEVAAPQAVSGMIVGVEKQKIDLGDKRLVDIEVLSLLTPAGLRSFRLPDVAGVKIKDAKVEGELKKALETLATSHDADKKTVTLNFSGNGKRRVRASYILEAPIWKTSYRLVLAEGKKPYLQGWATVENTTEADWNDVRLSLVSGRPISFIMDLYTPLYIARPVEELELYASLRPPTYEGGMDEARQEMNAITRRLAGSPSKLRAAPPMATAESAGAGGGPRDMAAEFDLADSGVASVATAQQAGELFSYDIQTPISLKRQQSAMLPIASGEVDGVKLSIYNPATHAKYPLNGIEMTNSTGLNLMQGPVTVFDGSTYAGDAKLPDLRPQEKRLLSYALDLAVEVEQISRSQPDEMVSLRIAKGTLWHRRKYVSGFTYNVKNKDGKARTILVEHPFNEAWKLIEPKEYYERTPSVYRFKVDAAANSNASLAVTLEMYGDEAVALTDVGLDRIQFYLKARVVSAPVKAALEEVVRRRTAVDAAARDCREAERQISEIEEEQNRLRENLKTLPQNSDLARRYLTKLDSQETQIEQLRAQAAELRDREKGLRDELEAYLLSLDLQ